LQAAELSPATRTAVEVGMRQIDRLNEDMAQARGQIEWIGRRQPACRALTSPESGSSSSCSSGDAERSANVSAGSSKTGTRLIVASAAPVTMLVAPGPTLVDTAQVCSRSRIRV
jgi:hypothetical protein